MSELGIFTAIHTTRAIRHLRADPVPEHLISEILDAGVRAPSAGNTQPWLFVAVTDPTQRSRIAEIYRDAGEATSRLPKQPAGDRSHLQPEALQRLNTGVDHLVETLADVPLLIVAASRLSPARPAPDWTPEQFANDLTARRLSAAASVYPAVQNMLLACRALGLGSVMTTLANRRQEDMRQALDLPDDVTVYAMLPIGFPDEGYAHGPVRRKPLADVACLDRYGQPWPGKPEPR